MIRRCLISYACNGREWYTEGLKRLVKSAVNAGHGFDPDNAMLLFSPDIDVPDIMGVQINRGAPGFPSHKEIPYGFKPWLFKLAFSLGFEQVLWCDSTIVIHKDLGPIWKMMEERGLFVADNPGCPMRFWTSDDAMKKMGCPFDKPEDAMFNEIMACSLGIDIRDVRSQAVFSEWWELCNDGVTFAGRGGSQRPEFRGHRHDQSAMSWLVEKHQIQREPYGALIYHGTDMVNFPEFILANTGIHQK